MRIEYTYHVKEGMFGGWRWWITRYSRLPDETSTSVTKVAEGTAGTRAQAVSAARRKIVAYRRRMR